MEVIQHSAIFDIYFIIIQCLGFEYGGGMNQQYGGFDPMGGFGGGFDMGNGFNSGADSNAKSSEKKVLIILINRTTFIIFPLYFCIEESRRSAIFNTSDREGSFKCGKARRYIPGRRLRTTYSTTDWITRGARSSLYQYFV